MKNTYDFLVQVRNFLLPLSLKVFWHKERGTIFLCWLFHLPTSHQHVWHPPQGHCELAKVTLLPRTARLNSLTFVKSPKILRACFRCMRAFILKSYLGFLFWHLWMTHPPRVRMWTPALMLHLTNPCAKRKVLSITKPKS